MWTVGPMYWPFMTWESWSCTFPTGDRHDEQGMQCSYSKTGNLTWERFGANCFYGKPSCVVVDFISTLNKAFTDTVNVHCRWKVGSCYWVLSHDVACFQFLWQISVCLKCSFWNKLFPLCFSSCGKKNQTVSYNSDKQNWILVVI